MGIGPPGCSGVLATGCAALLGFVVFLAFTSYNSARTGAGSEARTTAQQVETAQRVPAGDRGALTTPLICYARSAVGVQWDRMRADTLGEDLGPWGDQIVRRHQALGSKTAIEQAAYSKWHDERSAREEARSDRIHGAIGVIPLPLWLVLFFTLGRGLRPHALLRGQRQRAVVQGLMMGTVVAVIVAMLLLLQFLNNLSHEGIGSLRPDAMDRTLKITIRSSFRPNEKCGFRATSKAIRCRSTRRETRFGPAPCTP
jgi:hypothetical protein